MMNFEFDLDNAKMNQTYLVSALTFRLMAVVCWLNRLFSKHVYILWWWRFKQHQFLHKPLLCQENCVYKQNNCVHHALISKLLLQYDLHNHFIYTQRWSDKTQDISTLSCYLAHVHRRCNACGKSAIGSNNTHWLKNHHKGGDLPHNRPWSPCELLLFFFFDACSCTRC